MIVGSGRCRPTAKRGRCLIRLNVYFVALCDFDFQIYIAANLRKFENDFLRAVGNGGREMVGIVKIEKKRKHCIINEI